MSYLQKPWANPIENPTFEDIETAMAEVQRIGEEHNAFWMATDENDIVLELQKDMTVTLVLCGEICRESRCTSWGQAKELYRSMIEGDYEKVKNEFDCL